MLGAGSSSRSTCVRRPLVQSCTHRGVDTQSGERKSACDALATRAIKHVDQERERQYRLEKEYLKPSFWNSKKVKDVNQTVTLMLLKGISKIQGLSWLLNHRLFQPY
jgi:hypothetical protein